MECKIYVVTHKECFYKTPLCYVPIQVGKANTGVVLPYLHDDTDDNIAEKNLNYCELTAWYWLWKNELLPDYVGLCHYRRFFVKKTSFLTGGSGLLEPDDVNKIMKNYDIILPREINCNMTVKEFYYKHGEGKKEDIEKVESIIRRKYPDYVSAMESVFNSNRLSYWNLAVFRREHFSLYCDWLFDILFELESNICLDGYTPAEARIYGYIAEILLSVWVNKQNLKIYRSGMIFVDDNKFKNILRRYRAAYFIK